LERGKNDIVDATLVVEPIPIKSDDIVNAAPVRQPIPIKSNAALVKQPITIKSTRCSGRFLLSTDPYKWLTELESIVSSITQTTLSVYIRKLQVFVGQLLDTLKKNNVRTNAIDELTPKYKEIRNDRELWKTLEVSGIECEGTVKYNLEQMFFIMNTILTLEYTIHEMREDIDIVMSADARDYITELSSYLKKVKSIWLDPDSATRVKSINELKSTVGHVLDERKIQQLYQSIPIIQYIKYIHNVTLDLMEQAKLHNNVSVRRDNPKSSVVGIRYKICNDILNGKINDRLTLIRTMMNNESKNIGLLRNRYLNYMDSIMDLRGFVSAQERRGLAHTLKLDGLYNKIINDEKGWDHFNKKYGADCTQKIKNTIIEAYTDTIH
jgi:hypothetical protein